VELPVHLAHTCFPLAATLVHATGNGQTPNFDLSLEAPGGALLDSSATTRRQEDVSWTPSVTGDYKLRVHSASGAGGFFVDVSGALQAGAPCATANPAVSGTPQVGAVLTGSDGGWSAGGPPGYGRQWLRCDALGGGCTPIAGQVQQNHTVTEADVGHTLRMQVTATDPGGSGVADSSAVGPATDPTSSDDDPPAGDPPVGDPPPPPGSTHTGTSPPGGGQPGNAPAGPSAASVTAAAARGGLSAARALRRAGLRRLLRRRSFVFRGRAASAGTMSVKIYARPGGRRRAILVARASRTLGRAGSPVLRVRLTGSGRWLLRRARKLRLVVKIGFVERSGRRSGSRREVTVRR
jgi:hypothetical protein